VLEDAEEGLKDASEEYKRVSDEVMKELGIDW